FFFQAEDGIRDGHVTGVQTCALPIFFYLQEYFCFSSWRLTNSFIDPNRNFRLVVNRIFNAPFFISLPPYFQFRQTFTFYISWCEIGRASCRERVYMLVVDVVL